jgi:hypothetical protein
MSKEDLPVGGGISGDQYRRTGAYTIEWLDPCVTLGCLRPGTCRLLDPLGRLLAVHCEQHAVAMSEALNEAAR